MLQNMRFDELVMHYIMGLIYSMRKILQTTALPIAFALLGVQSASAADPRNPLALRPHHITAAVADLERAANWYQQMLGFKIRQRGNHGDVLFVELAIPGFGVSLIKEPSGGEAAARSKDGAPRWLHFVFGVPDPDAAYHALELKGATLAARRLPNGHIQSFLFADSEGNELEIIQDSPT
jgi:catechol 2,3-dioxygenase-like lactoylglutathione lyase family enzyme